MAVKNSDNTLSSLSDFADAIRAHGEQHRICRDRARLVILKVQEKEPITPQAEEIIERVNHLLSLKSRAETWGCQEDLVEDYENALIALHRYLNSLVVKG